MTVQFKLDINQIRESRMNAFYRHMLVNIHEALENDPNYIKEFNEWKEKNKNEN